MLWYIEFVTTVPNGYNVIRKKNICHRLPQKPEKESLNNTFRMGARLPVLLLNTAYPRQSFPIGYMHGAPLPLNFETVPVELHVDQDTIDEKFDRLTEDLTEE